MDKKKITLQELQVKSFVTELDEEQLHQVRGGFIYFRGRRYSYRTRWTSVDTRSESDESSFPGGRKLI